MKPLVIIPARGGSKGVPGKNLKPLNGKPLILYSTELARQLFDDSMICVSTDDIAIKNLVEQSGLAIPFTRPAHLATDTSSSYDVLLHAVSYYEELGTDFDSVLLLQPTSPVRVKQHILDVIALLDTTPQAEMVVSVKESKENPYFNLFEENDGGFLEKSKHGDYVRRQDCPKVYAYNGSIYLIRITALKKRPLSQFQNISKYVMEDIYNADIDTPQDWMLTEYNLSVLNGKNYGK
ncbi:acylneuraminate cytidylyltransferase family protein [Mucilaginibacter rigui]|uniref:Acylneuraminate cytidylyltransferase family protein n=1 Tax=Mucilaginibacter rigui TaxID=534635 RepID=A0ABR7X6M3_9SPHI|nr:acylneuraminate cytidylyltransferase family protein [Mucilaginibacter rigui]MBD1386228.1 acylneuraminate cytidylyltransferase family protein [Mucilaginibacter rigui]